MKRHERALGGTPSRALTERRQRMRVEAMEPEPEDLTIIEAAQRIIALHNEDPGPKGGYILYDPFTPKRFEGRRRTAQHPRIGYVAIAAGHELKREPLQVELLVAKIERARAEQSDPGSGRVPV